MIFSISVPHVFAQSNMFAGTGDLEVGENEMVDLFAGGVAAPSPTGENLQVTVKNVTCETNGNYQYDGSGVLNAGSGGSVYRIEYEAVSPANAEERYSTTRKITVLPSKTPISEEMPETFAEEITEVTSEEITETLPEGVTEEASEEVPETLSRGNNRRRIRDTSRRNNGICTGGSPGSISRGCDRNSSRRRNSK